MAKRKTPRNGFVKIITLILALVAGFIFTNLSSDTVPSLKEGELQVHFVDVGQADCQIILLPNNQVMMIDAGNNDDSEMICEYMDYLNIDKIDYLVGTHPHEDHIGSLDAVINNYEIENIYMPDATADTKTYRDVIKAAENNNLNITTGKSGMTVYSDDLLNIEIVAPVRHYDDLNNASIVIHLRYNDSSFLFTGDAEELSENDITANVAADVLSVGHHGSSTSTSDDFLERVDPMYAVISCGEGNDYGHPHYETLEKLEDNDITIYRTDRDGTIVCTTKGKGPADYKWETIK